MKKIKLTTKTTDLSEVLSNLLLSEDFKNNAIFTLEVEIEETAENYKYLSLSDKIIKWDFEKEAETEDVKSCQLPTSDCKITHSCCSESINVPRNEIQKLKLRNYLDIIRLIDSFREAKIYNNYIQLDDLGAWESVRSIYFSKFNITYSSDLEFLVSSSYFGNMLDEDIVISDILNKLNIVCNSSLDIFSTIDSLINKLYS